MEKYISKSALVAEIERRTDELYDFLPDASKVENGSITMSEACNTGKYTVLESFRRFIDTLEVKEVNEVPATVMVNKYGNRFISSWSGLKEYDGFKKGEEIKILIPEK